jgi:branched-chain amino acid transport system permease protein
VFGVNLAGEAGSRATVFIGGYGMPSVNAYYFLFLFLCVAVVFVTSRLQHSRLGRAWVAIREDEIAAKAMGINTRNVKLLAFSMGASFGGVAGAMFGVVPGLCVAGIVLADRIDRRAGDGGAGRHRPHSWRDHGRRAAGGAAGSAAPRGGAAAGALFGHVLIEAEVLRQLLYGLAMVLIMLNRPAGLWPAPKHEDRPDGDSDTKNQSSGVMAA